MTSQDFDEKFLVDEQDKHLLTKYKWRLLGGRSCIYAVTNINKKIVRLHRLIMNAKKGDTVDHINRNTLDNRRSNLRICSHSVNMRNKGNIKRRYNLPKNIAMHRRQYAVQFKLGGKSRCRKLFKTVDEAVKYRDQWMIDNNWLELA